MSITKAPIGEKGVSVTRVPTGGTSVCLSQKCRHVQQVCIRDSRQGESMEPRRLLALTTVMVVYLCVGAAVFNALEAKNEEERKADLEKDIDRFLGNNSCVSRDALHKLLFKASRDGELVYYILHNKTHLDRWDFSGAFGFSISVVTTIGFGNLAPHTMEGKVVVVVYAIMGIPLMLLLLAGIGEKLASLFKRMHRFNVCTTKPQVNRVINAVLIAALGMVVGFIAPATLFHLIEDWHFLEALYFCFTTLSTIGFGDYIIGIHERKISEGALHETYEVVAYVWILFGLAYVSLVIKFISDVLVTKAQKVEEKTVKKLEGTRLFRKISTGSKDSSDIPPPPKSPGPSYGSLDQSVMPDPGESPPPVYSVINGGFRGSGGGRASSSSGSGSGSGNGSGSSTRTSDTLCVETEPVGVELLSVNYM